MKKLLCWLGMVCLCIGTTAQDTSMYQRHRYVVAADTLPYRLLLPANYDAGKTYPLVVFLHGAGERGTDNNLQLIHGAKLFLQPRSRDSFPAIVVMPQCRATDFWSNVRFGIDNATQQRQFEFLTDGEPTPALAMVMGLTRQLMADYAVNPAQVYVMGLSMGGMGTFELVRRMPGVFAAAVPICGGANPATAPALKTTAWWIFHGEKDDVVPLKYSTDMVTALSKIWGTDLQFTSYPGMGHNSWDPAFAEPQLLRWLFSKRR